MIQTTSLTVIIILIILILIVFIFWNNSKNEKFSPYRGTNNCPPRTGYTYLDAYEQEDYYKNYPYIYPTPSSYTTEWYDLKRKDLDYNSDKLTPSEENCLCIPDNFYI